MRIWNKDGMCVLFTVCKHRLIKILKQKQFLVFYLLLLSFRSLKLRIRHCNLEDAIVLGSFRDDAFRKGMARFAVIFDPLMYKILRRDLCHGKLTQTQTNLSNLWGGNFFFRQSFKLRNFLFQPWAGISTPCSCRRTTSAKTFRSLSGCSPSTSKTSSTKSSSSTMEVRMELKR